jgi:aspartate/methionine/tyrosine aminotransferase
MLAANTRDLGFTVHEPQAHVSNHFFPDAESVALDLAANRKLKIFIYTPLGNPNGSIADVDKTAALLDVLREEDMTLIVDFAYLGTGSISQTQQIGQLLSTYPKRLDVVPMTKFFGRPGLRVGGLLTPHADLAKQFMGVAQNYQPTESYAAQAEALALWDLVTLEDRLTLAAHFQKRQEALITYLRKIDQERRNRGEKPLLDLTKPIAGDASLYVLVPLAEGLDPFDLVTETGLVGTPAAGFFASGQTGYMRFAIGAEEINF